MEFLRKVFTDESGNPSSNRIFGALVVVVGLVLVCVGKTLGIGVLTAGAGLLGAGQFKSAFIGAATTTATQSPNAVTATTPPTKPASGGDV